MRRSEKPRLSTAITTTDRIVILVFAIIIFLMCSLASVGGYRRAVNFVAPVPAATENEFLSLADSAFELFLQIGVILLVCLTCIAIFRLLWPGRAPILKRPLFALASRIFQPRKRKIVALLRDYKHEVAPGVWEGETAPPVKQFVTTYQLGDDRYDPSISLEERGEFLGECGVGFAKWTRDKQSHLIPAFEVWLFDKNDLQTRTHILASEGAARDLEAREKLPDGAVLVVAREKAEIMLQAKTLRLRARVGEVAYLAHDRQPDYYFERLKLEIAVWRT